MNHKLNGLGVMAAAAALIAGGAVAARAATGTAGSPAAATSTAAPGSDSAAGAAGHPGGRGGGRGGHRTPGTAVTGDELAKVTAAVKAKDAAVTVDKVFKTTDGSYLAMGTKSGNRIGFQISADLTTITEHTPRPGPGRGPGPGAGRDRGTAVTGDELTKVTAAVKTKDAAVTVEKVFKTADGSYRVRGTKAGKPVGFKVSADLKTITERAGR